MDRAPNPRAPGPNGEPPAARWRWIEAAEAGAFARDVLLAYSRTLPVVAVTTGRGSDRPTLDPDALATQLGSAAEVVALVTGDATWALSEALPSRLDVYDGAARIWWPGLTAFSDPYHHPLLFVHDEQEAELVSRRILAAVLDRDARAGRSGPWSPGDPALPSPTDGWRRLAEVCGVGDVVRGRVSEIEDGRVLVEVLPGVVLPVPIREIDWTFVRHPSDVVDLGAHVNLKILDLEPEQRRGVGSIKQAYGAEPPPALSSGPGRPPFLADDPAEAALADEDDPTEQLRAELDSALADRGELMERLKAANARSGELRKELRSREDKLRAIEARMSGDLDPTESENAFLTAVRVEYARRMNESDRRVYPLGAMRVGPEFLDRLRALTGVSIEKVVEVCAQVACQRAHEVPSREVHPLREKVAGAPSLDREADGARAWRCSLQDGTASARRLHWWDIPGKDGRTIEFASVAVHDDFSIPS